MLIDAFDCCEAWIVGVEHWSWGLGVMGWIEECLSDEQAGWHGVGTRHLEAEYNNTSLSFICCSGMYMSF